MPRRQDWRPAISRSRRHTFLFAPPRSGILYEEAHSSFSSSLRRSRARESHLPSLPPFSLPRPASRIPSTTAPSLPCVPLPREPIAAVVGHRRPALRTPSSAACSGALAVAPLPSEIWALVISALVPPRRVVALPASHDITRTLWSLSLASHVLCSLARPLLYRHCVHIDSPGRLAALVTALGSSPAPGPTVESILLAPFPDDSIEHPDIVADIAHLLPRIASSLRRLVVDIPFRSLYPEDDTKGLRQQLRVAFESLQHIEEFVSARDELFLAATHPSRETPLWARWRGLERLALYNADVGNADFVDAVVGLPHLTVLTLGRCDGLDTGVGRLRAALRRKLHVRLLDTHDGHTQLWHIPEFFAHLSNDAERNHTTMDLDFLMVVVGDESVECEDDIQICQAHLRDGALDGSLWSGSGRPILAVPLASAR